MHPHLRTTRVSVTTARLQQRLCGRQHHTTIFPPLPTPHPPRRQRPTTNQSLHRSLSLSTSVSRPQKRTDALPPRPTLPDHEIKHAYLKGSGPGGQKINKTSSAVQLTHLPTGLVVKSQATRSRSQNHTIARRILAEKIEVLERGAESRVAKKIERARKKKASKVKKARRKYRRLEEEGRGGAVEGGDGGAVAVAGGAAGSAFVAVRTGDDGGGGGVADDETGYDEDEWVDEDENEVEDEDEVDGFQTTFASEDSVDEQKPVWPDRGITVTEIRDAAVPVLQKPPKS